MGGKLSIVYLLADFISSEFSRYEKAQEFTIKYGHLSPEQVSAIQEEQEIENKACYTIYNMNSRLTFLSGSQMLGLINEGNTCYLNSLLQMFYHIPYFRQVIYDTTGKSGQVAFEMKKLFSKMQQGTWDLCLKKAAASTKALTKSFGWSNFDEEEQEDVHEMIRTLFDSLEQSLPNKSEIRNLFCGELRHIIECLKVNVKSITSERFYDIALHVDEIYNLDDALNHYFRRETLTGPNRYRTEKYGLQIADKYYRIKSLPPILMFQLKKFRYHKQYRKFIKISEPFNFPEVIDMQPYLDLDNEVSTKKKKKQQQQTTTTTTLTRRRRIGGHQKSLESQDDDDDEDDGDDEDEEEVDVGDEEDDEEDDDDESNNRKHEYYRLLSFIVHGGSTISSGHYFTIVNPMFGAEVIENPEMYGPVGNLYFLFNDANVSPIPKKEAFEVGYGSPNSPYSAYILVYVKETEIGKIIDFEPIPPTSSDINIGVGVSKLSSFVAHHTKKALNNCPIL